MLRLIFFLVVAAALAVVGVWLANHPGSVVVDWEGRTLETSVGIAILAFLVAAAVIVLLFELLRWLGALPARVREYRRHSREVRGYQALTGGLVAAAAGDLASARSLYGQAERLLPDRGSVLLLGAQAAQLEGKEEAAHLKFRQMLRDRETELLGLRGLLAQALRTGDQAEALSLARRAYRRGPTTPWVLTTLFDLLARGERWDEALSLVAELAAQKLVPDEQARRHRAVLHHMIARGHRDENRPSDALAEARRAVKLAPAFAPAAVLAAEMATQQGKRRLAPRVLEEAWRAAPHPDVGHAYARLVQGEAPEARLQRFDKRLRPLRPDHPELHVALGEIAIQAGRWDRARQELERALALEPTPRVYRLLAELDTAAGTPARAQEWLAKAVDAQPDHAWVCEDTGEALPEWRPFGQSGRFDVVRWSVPAKVAPLQGSEYGALIAAATASAATAPATVTTTTVVEETTTTTPGDDDGGPSPPPPRSVPIGRLDDEDATAHRPNAAATVVPPPSTTAPAGMATTTG